MNFKYLLCILLFLILRGISFSQESELTNQNIVDQLIDESLIPLGNKFQLNGDETFYNLAAELNNQQQSYIVESIIRKYGRYKILINENSDSIDYRIVIKEPVIRVRYKNFFTDRILGTKKVKREVFVSYDIEMIDGKTSGVVFRNNFNKKLDDSFGADRLDYVEDRRYQFLQSELPEESGLNKILFPAIIIATSAAAIILFFIIRSK